MNARAQVLPHLLSFLSAVGCLAYATQVIESHKDPAQIVKQHREPMITPPRLIDKFAFGHKELLADITWIRAIQDFDYCGIKQSEKVFSETYKREMTVCKNGWIFQMLDAATRLAPRYRVIYSRGAIALSVVVNDYDGAAILFERGTAAIPNDWIINYYAGYHYAVEMKDPGKAAQFIEAAIKGTDAPRWLALYASRLYSEAGRAEFGIRALKEFYKDTPYDEWPIKAKQRLKDLESALK